MKITFILKNFSEVFYKGLNDSDNQVVIRGLLNMPVREQFECLNKKATEYLSSGVSQKIGNGSFRDKVELNQILRRDCSIDFKLESRRGYKLATFEIK